MSTTAQRSTPLAPGFHLFAEQDEATLISIHVPCGLNHLVPGNLQLCTARPRGVETSWLEPIVLDGTPRLLLGTPRGVRARINGLPAPPIAILGVRDRLRFGSGPVLLVSAYRSPRIERPSGALLEQSCGLCRTALSPATTVVVHECGVAYHLEPPAEDEAERLLCATVVGECSACRKPVRTEAGWDGHPREGTP